MIISCTKKLQEELNIKVERVPVENRIYGWHGHMIRINRRKALVLVNDSSRYQVVWYGLKAKDLKNIQPLIVEGIRTVMLADGVSPMMVDAYLEGAGEIQFSKSQGAKHVAWINKGCELAALYEDRYVEDTLIQMELSIAASHFLGKVDHLGYVHPYEVFYELLKKEFDQPLFSCKAVELSIKLEVEGFDIRRNVVVPLWYSFRQLHRTIQILFDWCDYHLHEFTVYEGGRAVLNLVDDKELYETPCNAKTIMEQSVPISSVLPKHKHLVYCYDFGDDWVHSIRVERIHFDYDKNHPICLEGVGDAPLEDVGGERGHALYMEVKNDPNHEGYEEVKCWAGYRWNRCLDLEMVNRSLRYCRP